MKVLHILVIILLISLCKGEQFCEDVNPTKAADCKGLKIRNKGDHCCYNNYKYFEDGQIQNGTFCAGLTNYEYDNIINIVKSKKGNIKENGGIIDAFEIDCSSYYLYISLLSLIILLI